MSFSDNDIHSPDVSISSSSIASSSRATAASHTHTQTSSTPSTSRALTATSASGACVIGCIDRRTVLPEQDYVDTLEHLIRRDFYPITNTVDVSVSRENREDESISTFIARYTSEDSASFAEVEETERSRRKRSYDWIDANAETKRKTAKLNEVLAITDDRKNSAIVEHRYETHNSLMFVPESTDTPTSIIKERVRATGTRFQEYSDDGVTSEASTSVTGDTTDVDDGISTPRIGGYKLVKTPIPVPDEISTPLMTWGNILSTPTRIDDAGNEIRGLGFFVPTVPDREKVARRLGKVASQRIAKRKRDTSSMKGNRRCSADRTPTAMKLLSRARSSKNSALRASYSSTPNLSRSRNTASRDTPLALTPQSQRSDIVSRETQSNSNAKKAHITDGLLDGF